MPESSAANNKEPISRTRRHWQQFGLRSLLILFTLTILLVAGYAAFIRPWQERDALRVRLDRLGASYKSHTGPTWLARILGEEHCQVITEIQLPHTSLTGQPHDEQLFRSLGLLTELERLELPGRNITDETLSHWSGLQRLKHLDLSHTLVENPEKWPEWPLEVLSVSNTRMTDVQLARLIRYPKLRSLDAHWTGFGDQSVEALANLSQLESLGVFETRITPASWATLARFPALDSQQEIRASRVELPVLKVGTAGERYRTMQQLRASIAAGLPRKFLTHGQIDWTIGALTSAESFDSAYRKEIRELPDSTTENSLQKVRSSFDYSFSGMDALYLDSLKIRPAATSVNLGSPYMEDARLNCLEKFPNLERLTLSGCWITDAGLKHLANCPQLRELSLQDTRITDAGLKSLSRLCANLRVLNLAGTQITHQGLPCLTGLPELDLLIIPLGALRGPELSQLHVLPKSTHLRVAVPGQWDKHSRLAPPWTASDLAAITALEQHLALPPGSGPVDQWKSFTLVDQFGTYAVGREDVFHPYQQRDNFYQWLTFTPEAFEQLSDEQRISVRRAQIHDPEW